MCIGTFLIFKLYGNNSPHINVHLYNWMISCNIIILEVSNADIIDKVYSNITITIMGELYQLSIHRINFSHNNSILMLFINIQCT